MEFSRGSEYRDGAMEYTTGVISDMQNLNRIPPSHPTGVNVAEEDMDFNDSDVKDFLIGSTITDVVIEGENIVSLTIEKDGDVMILEPFAEDVPDEDGIGDIVFISSRIRKLK